MPYNHNNISQVVKNKVILRGIMKMMVLKIISSDMMDTNGTGGEMLWILKGLLKDLANVPLSAAAMCWSLSEKTGGALRKKKR